MDIENAVLMFDALSQETRLSVLRLLVEAGEDGIAAGVISERLGTPHNTLSFHLRHLTHAGMITSSKEGRSIIYRANFNTIAELITFLVKDCCNNKFATIQQNNRKGCCTIELLINNCQ